MAGLQKDVDSEYVLKKGGADVIVEPCKGWSDPCEYCDKRFGEWLTVDEDLYEKIPEKPGFAMISLKNKNNTEIVSIIYDQSSIQKSLTTDIDEVKDHISDKKSKASKSIIQVRWMIIKKEGDKENGVLCAHWYNNGTLPKFLKSWPGQKFLEESQTLELSKQLQKWCYVKKNPVWRKTKPPSSKVVEEVKKCNLQSCETCDEYFPAWKPLLDVVADDIPPQDDGIVMFSAVTGKKREIVAVLSDKHRVVVNIKSTVKQFDSNRRFYVRDSKFKENTRFDVRWMIPTDINSDNSCFLYAHWLNADNMPVFNHTHMPGESILEKNKNFVLRTSDKKWLYEIEAFKQPKFNKAKNKRNIRDLLNDQLESESSSD